MVVNKTLSTLEKKELEINRTIIKPKLKKYLIDKQVKQASETTAQKKKDTERFVSREDVLKAATKLSMKAFFDIRIWERKPPIVSMKWLIAGTETAELQREMKSDIAGFSTYLVREYYQFIDLKDGTKRGYLNPLQEDNLMFFWGKFNIDLSLLIAADKKRIQAGNAGLIIANSIPPFKNLKN